MPVHLEKGPTLTLFERRLNRPNRRPGYERRQILQELRQPTVPNHPVNPYPWLTGAFPFLTQSTPLAGPLSRTGVELQADLRANWFGDGSAGVTTIPLPGSTGYWIGYSGDVAEIVRRATCWAVELSLGLPPDDPGNGSERPKRIEIFWVCPSPWFEAWAAVRPGTVSLLFLTPSHQGSNVSETPIATATTTRGGGSGTPVPSTELDYEELGVRANRPPRVAAQKRRYATWVVTESDHELSEHTTIDVGAYASQVADLAEWGIPTIGVYEGTSDVRIVSPSFPAGGVHHHGRM